MVFVEKTRRECSSIFMGSDCPRFTPQPKLPPVLSLQVTLGQHLVAAPASGLCMCVSYCIVVAVPVRRYALVTPVCSLVVAVCCTTAPACCPLLPLSHHYYIITVLFPLQYDWVVELDLHEH